MSPPATLPVAILISGQGTNMTAIARACTEGRIRARVAVVIADQAEAAGIARARDLGLDTQVLPARRDADRSAFEAALDATLAHSGAQLIALAGFMRVLSPPFVQRYAGRLLNIHPSLLPRHRGLHTHQRVLQAGEREHGASVHFVTAELDAGPVICQGRLAVHADDTVETLTARVHQLEYRIYPRVIGLFGEGRLELRSGTVLLDGEPLAAPLLEEEEHDPGLPRANASV